jgi:hypothetical protein
MMKRILSLPIGVLLLVALFSWSAHASPGAHGPNGEHLDAPAAINASGLARLPDGSVIVPKLAQRRMTIRTVMGHEAEHEQTVELNGQVAIDPNAGGRIQAAHGGRVEPGPRGFPVIGQTIKRGEVMAHVRHHAAPYEIGNQQAQLADLRANRSLAEKRVKRLEALQGTVPQKEIDAAFAELASFSQREQAIATSLNASEAIVSPSTGVVASASVLAGQVVDSKDVLFEVIDPARLIVEARTLDAQLAARIRGASLQGLPDVTLAFRGAAHKLDEGALPLVFQARTTHTRLAVGQPVTVIATLTDKLKGIALPAQAIVRNPANEAVVWIKAGAERFVPQPVEFRSLNATHVVIVKGLAPDNRVVVQGATLINQIR